MSDSRNIVADWAPGRNGGSYGVLTVQLGDEVLAAEKLDILRPKQRADFIERLGTGRPGIDRAALGAELLRLAGQAASKPEPKPAEHVPELDVSRIIRPELFHTPEVSGVAAPVIQIAGGRPRGEWEFYLRWHADGRRERRELESRVELPGSGQLWIHPQPGAPEPTLQPGWSAPARRAWLNGADPPDPMPLLKRLCERIAYHVDFPPDTAEGTTATLALWTVLTYVYPAWPCLPYLSIGGPLASGKTQLFRVLARLVFRPVESSNMTAPCLFRTLHERGGTLLLDEAERLRDGTPEAGELRSILLSGYKPGSPVMRLERVGERFRRIEFNVFGPKALAGIATLPEALASRCVRVAMFRATADSPKPRRRLDERPKLWAELRDDLHALALEHGRIWLALAGRPDVCPATFSGRDFELWQPLLALAAWLESCGAGGLLGIVQEHAWQTVEAQRDDSVPEADETVLHLLAEHVVAGTQRALKAGDLLREAREQDSTSFGKWTPKGIASALRRYGIETRKGRGSSGRLYSGVTLDALRRIERAYGLELGIPPANVPTRTDMYRPEPENGISSSPGGLSVGTCEAERTDAETAFPAH